jgi:hypothetical protein
MRPLFRKFTGSIQELFQPLTVVVTEPRPENQEVCRYEDIHEVELQHANPMQSAAIVPNVVG